MKYFRFLIISLIIIFSTQAQTIREIRDSVGFCWNDKEMDSFISWLESNSVSSKEFPSEKLVTAISPHDDYLYAGKIYFPIYKLINAKEIMIFGVTHGTVRKAINDPQNILILDDFNYWKGPYGNVLVSDLRDYIKNNLTKNFYEVNRDAHSLEHSIEALIPFIQYYNREIKITPIMVTKMSFERMDSIATELAEIVFAYMNERNLKFGDDLFIMISNDANHYGEDFNNNPFGLDETAHRKATDEDKRIADKLNGEFSKDKLSDLSKELWPETKHKVVYPLWCGRYPVIMGLLTSTILAERLNRKITGQMFYYSDTFTEKVLSFKESKMGITAPFSLRHWVGFFSAGFYLK